VTVANFIELNKFEEMRLGDRSHDPDTALACGALMDHTSRWHRPLTGEVGTPDRTFPCSPPSPSSPDNQRLTGEDLTECDTRIGLILSLARLYLSEPLSWWRIGGVRGFSSGMPRLQYREANT
jgi:hypothetical protein